MSRNILLLEPNYKNKYPPMGLMKLATYYRNRGDSVRFFKGNPKDLAATQLCEVFLSEIENKSILRHSDKFVEHIKTGKLAQIKGIVGFEQSVDRKTLDKYRNRYKKEDYVKYDVVCITTLFTFYWKETIDTINFAKKLCDTLENIRVGGIAATLLPDYIYKETGIQPHNGQLNKAGDLDEGDTSIIDELPLDYSILEEIDYKYPANNAYFAYMTRGCVRKCEFCAVPKLEPNFCQYISLKPQLERTKDYFGEQKDLLLMDNNVLASKSFNKIIDEIKACGFAKGATYLPESEYEIALKNLQNGFNERGYTRKIISIYDQISEKLSEEAQADFYLEREQNGCIYVSTATTKSLLALDTTVRPLYNKLFKKQKRMRYVDFNQGVDARFITDAKMKKLSEINIRPLRIAFDHFSMKDTYVKAVRLAAKHGIKDLSNYLLYNFEDEPNDLYKRLKLNIELCEELKIRIYSFPMKYHPIEDPEYFSNRDYTGVHWNRKFIRTVQAILNSTKGKIGKGASFFYKAFGANENEFYKLLYMPETMIIYRFHYEGIGLTEQWWNAFQNLTPEQRQTIEPIIHTNDFSRIEELTQEQAILDVLAYYKISRNDAEKQMKKNKL